MPSGDIFIHMRVNDFAVGREQTLVFHRNCLWCGKLTKIMQCLITYSGAVYFICVAGCKS